MPFQITFQSIGQFRAIHGMDIEELATLMANNMTDEIDAELFCKALIHEIVDDYMRGKIEPGQALDRLSFNLNNKLTDCWFPIDHPGIASKDGIQHRQLEIYIDFELPEVVFYIGSEGPFLLHLADPRFMEKAVRIVRDGLKEVNGRMRVYHYTFENGTYYLKDDRKTHKNNILNDIILASDTIAICFAIDNDHGDGPLYVLHKHGDPDNVHKWAKATRAAYRKAGMEDMARSITVIEGKFPVEEVNKCLDNTGYLKKFCAQYGLV